MNQERIILEERVANLERQITMFERMVHMLSGTLDNHFKRYDVVISSQQQQISELNAVLSTLLNDQHRHSEVLREKLSGALHGISATAASLNNTIHSVSRFNNRSMDPDSIFGEILGNVSPTNSNTNTSSSANKSNGESADVNAVNEESRAYDQRYNDNNNSNGSGNNRNSISKHNGGSTNNNSIQSGDERHFPPSLLSYGDFGQLQDPEANNESANPARSTTNQVPQSLYNDPANPVTAVTSNITSKNDLQPSVNDPNDEMDPDLKEEQYITTKGRKRKRSIYVGSFQFLKSPHSVMEVWKEYMEGINGQPSIREMETIYQTGWRRDPAVNKRYSRRKVLCKAIETGLARGYTLDYIVNLLEDYRYIDREKGLKQPIGWICQGNNIPDILR